MADNQNEEEEAQNEEEAKKARKRIKLQGNNEYIYETLFVKGDGSDITVSVLGQKWNLHRIFIRQAAFFRTLLDGSWKDTALNELKLDIPDKLITSEALHLAFQSMYRNDILVDPATVTSLLAVASLLSFEELIEQCGNVMTTSLDVDTVCLYYETSIIYGANDVPERCIEYLQKALMPNKTVKLMKDVTPQLMMNLIKSNHLLVISSEISVYVMLKMWMFLRLNPNYEGNIQALSSDSETFIKSSLANSDQSFLEGPIGVPFMQVFSLLRIEYIVMEYNSTQMLETERILPKHLIQQHCLAHWMNMLKLDNGKDIGPVDSDVAIFENRSMRCGRRLDSGVAALGHFSYGKKWALSYSQRRISLKRSISDNWQAQKKIIYQIAVVPAKGTYPQSLSQNTGVKSLSLKRYEEASVMTIDPKVTFPIYISCNFLFYTPSTEPSAAAVINAPQPPPNLSV